jgi:hypothetical protein
MFIVIAIFLFIFPLNANAEADQQPQGGNYLTALLLSESSRLLGGLVA